MGKVLAAAGWGEGEKARDRNVLLADLQRVLVVRFGGAAVTWRTQKAPAPTAVGRMGFQPPRATGSAGSKVGAAGLGLTCSLQSRAWGWDGFALFLDPSN